MFTPQFDIIGPVELPQERAFYGTNIRKFGQEVDKQLGTMIYDACMGLEEVDFSNYDNDGDGYKWAEKFGQREIDGMVARAKRAFADFDGFKKIIPSWYSGQ